MSPRPCLAICVPMARAPHPAMVHDLLMLEDVRPYHYLNRVGLPVDVARNQLTAQGCALENVTHFLFIDDDMTFSPDAAARLLAHDLPIVGGLCFNRRHPFMPTLMHVTARGFAYQYTYPEGLVEVDATGAAFLLVKKAVLASVQEKCNKARSEGPWTPFNDGTSEDVSFCIRARQLGYKTLVDTTVKIGHFGEIVVEEAFAKRNRKFAAKPWFPPTPAPEGPPVASVIIPTWNQKPEWLREAIESARAQTVPIEIIVVDDGSTKCSWCGVEDQRLHPDCPGEPTDIKYIRIDHGGCFAALNAGIRAMTTDWFVWLSSDDILYAPKVEQQLEATKRANAKASFHAYDVMVANGSVLPNVIVPVEWASLAQQQQILARGCFINGLTVMLHRSVFEEVGVFDTAFTISSDWEFWNRVGRAFFWHPICEVLSTRRDYDNASTRYAADPEKRAIWEAEDATIRAKYIALLEPSLGNEQEPL